MLKIRLMRIGTKKRPFYRVVVVDERSKRTGSYIDLLGTYNPLTNPKEIILDQTKITDWTKKGAQMSHGFLRIVGKAPQKPPRKPKKVKEEKKVTTAPETEEASTEGEGTAKTVSEENIEVTTPASTEEVAPAETPAATEEAVEDVAAEAEAVDEDTTTETPAEGETK